MKIIEAKEAWDLLDKTPNAHLIDVRTEAEWVLVGYPDIKKLKKDLIKLSYLIYPQMKINPDFVNEIEQIVPNKHDHLIFLCKTGTRSQAAANAMMTVGYVNCYNVIDGFEGTLDAKNHPGSQKGWKAQNLPWEQN